MSDVWPFIGIQPCNRCLHLADSFHRRVLAETPVLRLTLAPSQHHTPAGQEHGRTIPLADYAASTPHRVAMLLASIRVVSFNWEVYGVSHPLHRIYGGRAETSIFRLARDHCGEAPNHRGAHKNGDPFPYLLQPALKGVINVEIGADLKLRIKETVQRCSSPSVELRLAGPQSEPWAFNLP